MTRTIAITLCCVCLLLLESVNSLKCRTTGIRQTDDQFRRALQICKKRYISDNNYDGDSSSNESGDNKDSLSADVLDKFFMNNDNENDNWNPRNDQRSITEQRYSFNYMDGNRRNVQYPNHGNNDHDFGYYGGAMRSDYYNQMYSNNYENYNNKERDQTCIAQCFFDESNVVDRKGFPKQELVIQLMMHNVQNQELQDFMEEAVTECFRYLSSDQKQDKCYFSQNFLSCLADKGKERCEDWNN